MAAWRNSPLLPRPWVGWAAKQIHDPVSRLRFLRAAAARKPARARRGSRRSWYLLFLVLAAAPASRWRSIPALTSVSAAGPAPRPPAIRVEKIAGVWQVESAADHETYSNGLRIDT